MSLKRREKALGSYTHEDSRRICCLLCPTEDIRIRQTQIRKFKEHRRRLDLNPQLLARVQNFMPDFHIEDARYPLSVCYLCRKKLTNGDQILKVRAESARKKAAHANLSILSPNDLSSCACYICTAAKASFSIALTRGQRKKKQVKRKRTTTAVRRSKRTRRDRYTRIGDKDTSDR